MVKVCSAMDSCFREITTRSTFPTFISQDDKARVPNGLTATYRQAHLLINVKRRVSLPDHDLEVDYPRRL